MQIGVVLHYMGGYGGSVPGMSPRGLLERGGRVTFEDLGFADQGWRRCIVVARYPN